MPATLDVRVPVVGICNISETFFEFLSRVEDPVEQQRLVRGEQYRGDRALMWLRHEKLVIVSLPIPHAAYFCETFGYQQTRYLTPQEPSPWLCLDVLQDPSLVREIVAYAGEGRTLQLVPYATTPQFLQLVHVLRVEHGLTVLTPESPDAKHMWVRDYIDTKSGFHVLALRWLAETAALLPEGILCWDIAHAARVVRWFLDQERACLVKADIGENGLGNIVFRPDPNLTERDILQQLQANELVCNDRVTVEELIPDGQLVSPSVELFVPALGEGRPAVMHVANQLFLEFGDFCGALVSRELAEEPWYEVLVENGLTLGAQLQKMGYVGHFDLDAVVADDGRLYLVEVNSRRTGSTHLHDFALIYFGPAYLAEVAVLSHDAMSSGGISEFAGLRAALEDLLYPMGQQAQGIVITGTSALEVGEFGCIIVAASMAEAVGLQQLVKQRLRGRDR